MNKEVEYERATGETKERLAALEEHMQHAANQVDIARLEGKIETSVAELKGFIEKSVSPSEIKTLKQFVNLWVVGATIVISVVNLAINLFLN